MSGDGWHHPNKEWDKTLNIARRRGWPIPERARNHGGLVLHCPAHDENCRIRIFSTGGGTTENPARSSRKKIQRCPHGNFRDRFDEVEYRLTNAERLLRAAAAEYDRRDAQIHAELILQQADEHLNVIDSVLDDDYDVVVGEIEEHTERRDELLDPSEAGTAADTLVDLASGDLRDVDEKLKDLPSRHDRYSDLKTRLQAARELRDQLRAAFSAK